MMDKNEQHPDMSEAKAKEYSKVKIKLSIVNIVITIILLLVIISSGLSVTFRNWASSGGGGEVVTVFLYFVFFYILFWLLNLPLYFYASFSLEHKYELSNQTLSAWAWENCKKLLLGFFFGAIVIEGLYWFIRMSPDWWWLWCWSISFLFSVVLNKIFPVIIVPLFYKYQEIDDEELKEKIFRLVEDTKLKIKNVYSLNLSKTTKKANAMFCGLGKTKRVVLGDTLISNFSHPEIEVVVAHEVGHYKLKHIWKHIASATFLSLVAFYLIFILLPALLQIFHLEVVTDVAAYPIIALLFSVLNIIVMPLENAYSRLMEREADVFALKKTKSKEDFINTMRKLGKMNLADPLPHPAIEFIFYSHPSIQKRVDWAQSYQI